MINLLEASGKLIPGIEKALTLYYDINSNEMVCKGIKNPSTENTIENYYIADLAASEKLRNRKNQWQWLAADNLPFEVQSTQKTQFNIFDELNHLVLCLAFPNNIDHKMDLLFIYLNSNLGSFGISKTDKNLSTENKSIIGAMAYNCFKLFMQQQQTDSKTLLAINHKVNAIQQENKQLKQELEGLRSTYKQSILEMCRQHLDKLSAQLSVQFELANDAIQKLEQFSGNADILLESLTQSAVLAINLNFGSSSAAIVLKAWDIQINEPEISSSQATKIEGLHERYFKTFHLLEKLESAARNVINSHQKLTSENVGSACPTPISAPAISDALRNHQKKVINLMNEYPDNWPTIRNEFRPVKNIIENSKTG
ncbi:MAG: hypothetical protein JEZ09_16040 [Salinivirgaceae bacterium]|nr:hypothetical protein [Salinivirgaceae bacterium]